MKFNNINIINLRNHINTFIDFNQKINVFYGLNGAGKTTILEALSICSFSKSFLSVQDSVLINKNSDFYSINAELINDLNLDYKIKVSYRINSKKEINSTFGTHLQPHDIIGIIPLVTLSPDYRSITSGSPSDRRIFLDRVISQSSKSYLRNLMKLKKILKQRNNLLNQYKLGKIEEYDLIEPWTELLINTSCEIIKKRYEFIKDFDKILINSYYFISKAKENVKIEYEPFGLKDIDIIVNHSSEELKLKYKKIYEAVRIEEIKRGTTLFGPQKDEVKIYINNGIAREYASQGQHKTLLISIKLAEFEYLKNLTGETPVILLDDIFSELDLERAEKVLDIILTNSGQSFITITDSKYLQNFINNNQNCSIFEVINGSLCN